MASTLRSSATSNTLESPARRDWVRHDGRPSDLGDPPTLLPPSLDGWPVEVTHDLDAVIDDLDICYLLRMQLERQKQAVVPTLREYHHEYGLTSARADRLALRR